MHEATAIKLYSGRKMPIFLLARLPPFVGNSFLVPFPLPLEGVKYNECYSALHVACCQCCHVGACASGGRCGEGREERTPCPEQLA